MRAPQRTGPPSVANAWAPRTASRRTRRGPLPIPHRLVWPQGQASLARSDHFKAFFGVALAQGLLVELAHRGLGHLVDERPHVGHLPVGDPAGEELAQAVHADLLTLANDDRGQRPLAPC